MKFQCVKVLRTSEVINIFPVKNQPFIPDRNKAVVIEYLFRILKQKPGKLI